MKTTQINKKRGQKQTHSEQKERNNDYTEEKETPKTKGKHIMATGRCTNPSEGEKTSLEAKKLEILSHSQQTAAQMYKTSETEAGWSQEKKLNMFTRCLVIRNDVSLFVVLLIWLCKFCLLFVSDLLQRRTAKYREQRPRGEAATSCLTIKEHFTIWKEEATVIFQLCLTSPARCWLSLHPSLWGFNLY